MKKNKIYALGFFDGVHLGHQALLDECVQMAQRMGAIPAAITFDRHPQSLFSDHPPALLHALADRIALLRHYAVDHIRLLPVNRQTMGQNWQDFLQDLLLDGAKGFVCGYDFRFGSRGEGNAEKLQAFCTQRNIPCVIVPEISLDGVRISSSYIRQLIEAGDVETAAKFLGHAHILSGKVVTGRQLGRTIGIPTANILIPGGVAVPKFGVYATSAHIQGKVFPTVTNIGFRPTVGGHQVRSESWVLDFDGDLYGQTVTLEFHKFLRPEQKFDSLQDLQAQIRRDAEEVRLLLR